MKNFDKFKLSFEYGKIGNCTVCITTFDMRDASSSDIEKCCYLGFDSCYAFQNTMPPISTINTYICFEI